MIVSIALHNTHDTPTILNISTALMIPPPTVLNIPCCTQDIPHCTLDIPHCLVIALTVLYLSSNALHSLHCVANIIYGVVIANDSSKVVQESTQEN